MAYKNPRLLKERLNKELDELRKQLMRDNVDVAGDLETAYQNKIDFALHQLNELREFVDDLGEMATRPSVDDVMGMSPTDYAATMKPLCGIYLRNLMQAGVLPVALCAELQAVGLLLVLIGEDSTHVRTAHRPDRPDVAVALDAMIAALDSKAKQVVTEGVAAAEQVLGVQPPVNDESDPGTGVGYCAGAHDGERCGAPDCYVPDLRARFGGSPDADDAREPGEKP